MVMMTLRVIRQGTAALPIYNPVSIFESLIFACLKISKPALRIPSTLVIKVTRAKS